MSIKRAPQPWALVVTLFLVFPSTTECFSTPNNNNNNNNNQPPPSSFSLFDRFRSECPALPQSIQQFDPSLPLNDNSNDNDNDNEAVWVAVFRTSNNAPSVFVKDEFFNAMRLATGGITETSSSHASSSNSSTDNNDNQLQIAPQKQPSPVAVARLCPSQDFPGTWTLDQMRCSLKKETTDDSCEGGSEHKEALSVAMDTLLLHYLNTSQKGVAWEGAIRTKATLVGASLLEERGFEPVTTLDKDMATHVSSLDASMEKYAEKYVETMSSTSKNQGARERANALLSRLGRIDREKDYQAAQERLKQQASANSNGEDDDDYDPWASVKQFV